jgi:hypothetical protein
MKYNKNTRFILKGDANFSSNKVNCNSLSNTIKPLITYDGSLIGKFNALDNNIGKSAIYRWVHRNGKSYVGSSKDLYRRLKYYYYNVNFLERIVLTSNSRIYKALLDDGYDSFTLEILEYCDKSITIEREQYYIDLIKPEYNIQNIAGIVLFQSCVTTVVNKKDNSVKIYKSRRAAAKDLRVNYSTLTHYVNKDKLLKGTYSISSKPVTSKREGCHR